MLKETVIDSCRHLLQPLIRFLLKHGVSWSEFAELSKEVYVGVARQDYGVQGRPTNNSRVAMLTGLSRRDVARIRDRILAGATDATLLHGNRISRILSGWHTDKDFLDSRGQPLELPATGSTTSLETLLKRYAGDLPHGAVIKELLQRRLVEEQADGRFRVLRRDFVYSTLDPEIVRRMSTALYDHAATLEHNLDENRSSAPRFEAVADNAMMSPSAARAFQDLVASRGLAFLEEVDAWLSENEIDEREDAGAHPVRLGVGVYLVREDSERGLIK